MVLEAPFEAKRAGMLATPPARDHDGRKGVGKRKQGLGRKQPRRLLQERRRPCTHNIVDMPLDLDLTPTASHPQLGRTRCQSASPQLHLKFVHNEIRKCLGFGAGLDKQRPS